MLAIADDKITILWSKEQKSNRLILVINGSIETCSGSALGKVTGLEVPLFPGLGSLPYSSACSPRPIAQPQGQPQALAPARFGCRSSSQAPTLLLEALRGRDCGSVCVQCSFQQGWKPPPAAAKVVSSASPCWRWITPHPQPLAIGTRAARTAARSGAACGSPRQLPALLPFSPPPALLLPSAALTHQDRDLISVQKF